MLVIIRVVLKVGENRRRRIMSTLLIYGTNQRRSRPDHA